MNRNLKLMVIAAVTEMTLLTIAATTWVWLTRTGPQPTQSARHHFALPAGLLDLFPRLACVGIVPLRRPPTNGGRICASHADHPSPSYENRP